jgi:hypothetical protein
MRLFLEGIQNPPKRHVVHRFKQIRLHHKIELLGNIRKLYIIHASSSNARGHLYMIHQGRSRSTVELLNCKADGLRTADLLSWIMASQLVRSINLRGVFRQLQSVSFGTWDTGRWEAYRQDEDLQMSLDGSDDSDSDSDGNDDSQLKVASRAQSKWVKYRLGKHACPDLAINRILTKIFTGPQNADTCWNARSLIQLDFRPGTKETMMVVHHSQLNEIEEVPYHPYKTRIYVSADGLREPTMDVMIFGSLCLAYSYAMKPVFRLETYSDSGSDSDSTSNSDSDSDSDSGSDSSDPVISTNQSGQQLQAGQRQQVTPRDPHSELKGMNLELCLVTSDEGNEMELRLARNVRDAWGKFERALQNKDGREGYTGRLKIYVGDECPACPCCGGRR